MASNRGRQKSLEKKKKRRVEVRSLATKAKAASSSGALVALAATSPFGPAYLTGAWRSNDEDDPGLVGVLLTRQLPDRSYVIVSCLVDRTCLGVKDAFVRTAQSQGDLDELVARYEDAHTDGVEEVSALEAQSVVYHAIDFARSLGFEPHRDLVVELLGPRPEALLDTPLARPSQPRYLPGPHDDVARITRVLDRHWSDAAAVGGASATPARLRQASELWLASFADRHAAERAAGFSEYLHGVLGRPFEPEHDEEAIAAHMSSLPSVWTALLRPMKDGRAGCQVARSFGPLQGAAMADALDRFAHARVLFGDLLALDRRANIATVRDAFDGAAHRLRLDPETARVMTRWTRLFCVVVELEDGTHYPPSTLLSHAWLRNVAPSTLVAGVNELLAQLGHREVIDEAKPQESLARWAGLAHGVLHRAIAPTEAQAKELARKKFLVNSDGDRFEPHEATIMLDAASERALATALGASDEFVRSPQGFEMFGAPRAGAVVEGESLGSVQPVRPGAWRVVANSPARYARLLARLGALAGHDLRATDLVTMRPWVEQPACAAEESDDTDRVLVATARIEAPTKRGAKAAVRSLAKEAPLRAIDEVVPAVGGKPRELVATPEGRARVELWLQEWELRGSPDPEGGAFLDLDPVRAELGLPRASAATSGQRPLVRQE